MCVCVCVCVCLVLRVLLLQDDGTAVAAVDTTDMVRRASYMDYLDMWTLLMDPNRHKVMHACIGERERVCVCVCV